MAGGFCATSVFLLYFSMLGYLPELANHSYVEIKVLVVALVGGLIESLAIDTWDNVTVSLSVASASSVFLKALVRQEKEL